MTPPLPKNFLGHNGKKHKVFRNRPVWRENWSKIFVKVFWPPTPLPHGTKKNAKNEEKNQSCSKLAQMARKLLGNYFRIFWHHPHRQKFLDETNVVNKLGRRICQCVKKPWLVSCYHASVRLVWTWLVSCYHVPDLCIMVRQGSQRLGSAWLVSCYQGLKAPKSLLN